MDVCVCVCVCEWVCWEYNISVYYRSSKVFSPYFFYCCSLTTMNIVSNFFIMKYFCSVHESAYCTQIVNLGREEKQPLEQYWWLFRAACNPLYILRENMDLDLRIEIIHILFHGFKSTLYLFPLKATLLVPVKSRQMDGESLYV